MFQCSDGDNWPGDNAKVQMGLDRLHDQCRFIGYCEVEPREEQLKWLDKDSGLFSLYSNMLFSNLKAARITAPHEIWPAFQGFFGGTLDV